MFNDLVRSNRSYRRFYQDVTTDMGTLRELVDLARLTPSGSNKQPLKYIISNQPEKNAIIFSHLGWAMQLKNWGGPPEGERPAAYILILHDTQVSDSPGCDQGVAAQTILLGAVEKGLGGCMLGSVRMKKESLCQSLKIPPRYDVLLAVALGKPKEKVIIEQMNPDGDTKYWRDNIGVHHVPKRRLEEIIIG